MKKLQNTLYVMEPDVTLHKEGETVCAHYSDGRRIRVPLHMLESITCFSYAGATSTLMEACARRGIGLSFLSPSGSFRYKVEGKTKGSVLLRKRQYILSESSKRVDIAREMIRGKVSNSVFVLEKFIRNHPEKGTENISSAISRLRLQMEKISDIQDEEKLRGLEGQAAKEYYGAFGDLILSSDARMSFVHRSRRPAKDPVNSLLSFAYAVLESNCEQALECVGLDPYVGFLHRDRPGKPSLALDLMEELRSVIADRFVLRLVNLRMIGPAQFEDTGDGIRLTEEGRRLFLGEWNRKRCQEIFLAEYRSNVPIGLISHLQARKLAHTVQGDADYSSIQWR